MKRFSTVITLSFLLLNPVTGCSATEAEMPGKLKDEYGCISSAGYSWSQLKSECVRIWEQGIPVKDSMKPYRWAGGYVIFSEDGKRAELHLADIKNASILRKKENIFENQNFLLKKLNGNWHLTRKKI